MQSMISRLTREPRRCSAPAAPPGLKPTAGVKWFPIACRRNARPILPRHVLPAASTSRSTPPRSPTRKQRCCSPACPAGMTSGSRPPSSQACNRPRNRMPLPARPPRTLRSRSQRINCHAGFTLIEMAVALVVVALLLGSLPAPLSSQVEQRKISEAQKILEQINDALMGFAMSQTPARLPCPDTVGNDGLEDACPFTAGSSTEGNVPWQTLAVPAADPWGQRYQYRVNGAFTTTQANGPPYLSLTTTPSGACNPPGSPAVGNIRICVDSACSSTLAN